MAIGEEEKQQPEASPPAVKTTASPGEKASQSNSSDPAPPPPPAPHPPKRAEEEGEPGRPQGPSEFIRGVAAKFASQPLSNSDPRVWGVLTAISNNARKTDQGSNMLLTEDVHKIGRMVVESHFQIDSLAVSGNHCMIYKKTIAAEALETSKGLISVFLKDTSTKGTYVNWTKLMKSDPDANINHGDIISFAAPPHQEAAYAFVFREVSRCTSYMAGGSAKRKGEEIGHEIKRLKGIGIGSLEGPIFLGDFRSLQRSNAELRKQLENQVCQIGALQDKNHASVELMNKLQDTERERCSLLDTLRIKLEDRRQNLVISDNKVRQLKAQLCEEKEACLDKRKRVEELELELRTLRKELESEKAALEEAWAKVSKLEIEISAAIRDQDCERRQLEGAQGRVMLRETQLRAFYSSTKEITVLFSKQQEQLKAMQRTLEDEENYENTLLDTDLNIDLNRVSTLAGDTMQLDEGENVQETADQAQTLSQEQETLQQYESNNAPETLKVTQDIEVETLGTIRTADLLASEVAGSWACSTALSIHGENESPRSRGENEIGAAPLPDSSGFVAESQSDPSSDAAVARLNQERGASTEMIGIVAPDLKEKFAGVMNSDHSEGGENQGSVSDSDMEDYTGSDHANGSTQGESSSDSYILVISTVDKG